MNRRGSQPKSQAIRIDGKAIAADILARLPESDRKRILGEMQDRDPSTAALLESRLYSFDDLQGLDEKDFRTLFESTSRNTWLHALRGASSEFIGYLRTRLSIRAHEALLEEVGLLGAKPSSVVDAARRDLVEAAKKLGSQGKLTLSKPSSEKS